MEKRQRNQLIVLLLAGVGIVALMTAGWMVFTVGPGSEPPVPTLAATVTIPTATAVPPTPTTSTPKTITLNTETITTQAATVADVLQEQNVQLGVDDRLQPGPETAVTENMTITIISAFPVTIAVDGRSYPLQTTWHDIPNLLAEAGIALVGQDFTIPAADTVIQPNDTIQVIRVSEDFQFTDTIIPYETVYQANPEMEIDSRALLTAGSPGILRQQVRIRYENGVPISETVDSEYLAQAPVNEVINYGTNVVIRTLNTPEGPLEYWRVVRMKVTGYTASSSGKAPSDPAYGITASGLPAGKGVVAIDPNVVPFRSNIYVEGYGKAIAGDTGGGVKGRIIDLGFDDGAYETWRGQVDVYYLTPVPPPENINYLIPTTIP